MMVMMMMLNRDGMIFWMSILFCSSFDDDHDDMMTMLCFFCRKMEAEFMAAFNLSQVGVNFKITKKSLLTCFVTFDF